MTSRSVRRAKPTSSTWQPGIFGGAGIQREPGKDRADEMRDSGSSDLFDALTEASRFRCSGRSAGRQDACTFVTTDRVEAFTHFEEFGHDVDEAPCPTLETAVVTLHRPVSGWPTMAELIARSIALGGDPFGPSSDDVEYGSWCPFCGNRAAVCRCDQ